MIMLTNYIIQPIVFSLIKIRGYTTLSKEIRMNMICVFLMQFLNTGPFTLIANADFSELNIPFISDSYFFKLGLHRDFTVKWYQDVGKQLIYTMCLYVAYPVYGFVMWYLVGLLKKAIDKSCWICGANPTRCRVIQDYLDLYCGPEYLIY